jgi:hypothetical protein
MICCEVRTVSSSRLALKRHVPERQTLNGKAYTTMSLRRFATPDSTLQLIPA